MKRLSLVCAIGMMAGVLLAGKPMALLFVAALLLAAVLAFGPDLYLRFRIHAGERPMLDAQALRMWLLLPVGLLLLGFIRQEWMLAEMNGLFAHWNGREVSVDGWVSEDPQADADKVVFTISLEPVEKVTAGASDQQRGPAGTAPSAKAALSLETALSAKTAPSAKTVLSDPSAEPERPDRGRIRATLYGHVSGVLPRYGDRVRISGSLRLPDGQRNPGGFDMAMYLAARGAQAQMTLDGLPVVRSGNRGNPLVAMGLTLKKAAIAQLDRYLPPDAAPVMAGMLLGETAALDNGLRESFRAAGLSHIMAVSGANIAFLLLPLMWLLKRFGINLRRRSAAALPLLALYVLMTGFDASIVRAAVMACVMLAGGFLWRKTDLASSLSVSLVLMLAANSAWLFDAGFQLSFLATAAIGLFLDPLSGKLPRFLPKTLRDTLAGTLSAQAGVLPVLTGTFHTLSLLSIPANLLVVPLTGFLTLAGALLVLSGLFLPILGTGIGQVLGFLITVLVRFVTWTAGMPGAAVTVATPPVFIFLLYGVMLGFLRFGKLLFPLALRRKWVPILILAGLILSVVSYLPSQRLEVIVADVGQGDGILLRTPAGKSIVIDGGGSASDTENSWSGEHIMLPLLWSEGIVVPDLLISTHPHVDHIAGLRTVADLAGAREIAVSDSAEADPLFERIARTKAIPVRRLSKGDIVWAEPGFSIKVLSPERTWAAANPDANEISLVLWLTYREFSMLFTADAGELAEQYLLETGLPGRADILKVGHHGAGTSTGKALLQTLHPRVAVISVGRNRYGHPAPETLQRLAEADTAVHVTRQSGAFLLKTDGRSFSWRPFVKPNKTMFDLLYR